MREWSAASDTEKSSRMRPVFHISMEETVLADRARGSSILKKLHGICSK